ncbi:DNA-binding protein [Streptomyces sp. HNM0663]|uniref:DNA-binding protein n=1 Tax=Streptomyces chengmaiensis TaxID=3040919 RepID=A0ABT6HHU2_9ACTN|nr:DNA-binding protein [Streptomyces chengmaiensis]MDH2388160.1 DNA-binding protein [Streptomyces chengmaiensis]
MTSHSRHSVTAVTLPYLFRPAEIAEALGCSEWWLKEQARRRRIPFTRLGGAYRFTAEHASEIVRLFEERPTRGVNARDVVPAQRSRRRNAEPTVRLVARPARRLRSVHQSATAL